MRKLAVVLGLIVAVAIVALAISATACCAQGVTTSTCMGVQASIVATHTADIVATACRGSPALVELAVCNTNDQQVVGVLHGLMTHTTKTTWATSSRHIT